MAKKEKEEPMPLSILPSVDMSDEEGMTVDEALAKVAMLLAQAKDPRVLSDINEYEVKLCSALYVVANKMKDSMLTDFLGSFLSLRISKGREGRKELLEIARSAREASTEGRLSRLKAFIQGIR